MEASLRARDTEGCPDVEERQAAFSSDVRMAVRRDDNVRQQCQSCSYRVAAQLAVPERGLRLPTDEYISKTLNIPVNKVQEALKQLETAGAIVRASSFVDGKPQRRIWPSTKIIPPAAGGIHTPRDDRVDTPHGGGTDSIETPRTRRTSRISTTAEAAKRDAERREQREQQRRGTASGDDSQNTLSDERGAPQAPPRLADAVIEGEIIIIDSGVAEAPPPDQLKRAVARARRLQGNAQ
jgi:hypothetical protein